MTAAPTRALGASAALIVLVVVPSLVTPPAKEKPTPEKGAVTVELSGSEGSPDPYMVKLSGPAPPPDKGITVHDDSGLHTGRVTPATGACGSARTRVAFDTEQTAEWCLKLDHVAAGHELAGTVTAGANEVAVTVRRRDGFTGWPLMYLLAGLVGGFLVALVPRWLRGFVRWIVLNKMLAANEKNANTARYVKDLEGWVTERRNAGDTRESLITAVHRVVESGPARAMRARQRLKDAIDALPALTKHSLIAAASAIADTTENSMTDFYKGSEERKQHPADDWTAAVALLAQYRAELDGQRRALAWIDPQFRKPAEDALAAAEERFEAIKDPDELATMTPRLEALRLAVDHGLAQTEQLAVGQGVRRGDGEAAAAPAVPRANRGVLETIIPLGLSAGTLKGWALIAKTATAALLLLALAYAFVTIKQAGYDAKPLFHSDEDYLTLFSAALASGAAATVIALVGNWKPIAGEDDEA